MARKIEDINGLLSGINVIANVLLVAKSTEDFENISTVDLYSSLVEVTEQYASTLLAEGGQFELRHEEQKKAILKSISGL
ncbi:MAG: hypothetical protein IKF82_06450 [Bacilli bacterium]|nr:hypothetical protein [bacterium]MBR3209889.1 hypothetical protein [Bacilli bacterium]